MKKFVKSFLSIILVFAILFGAAPLSGFKGVGSSLWKGLCSIAVSAKEGVEEIIENLTPENVSDNTLAASGQCGDNVNWTFDEATGALTISGTGKMWDYNGKYYFQLFYTDSPFSIKDIKSVVIEDGVTSIGDYAFYECTGLTSIEIPNSVTSIGSYAFGQCTSLTSIELPDSVTSIGKGAFSGCTGLTSVKLPDSVTSIGEDAFFNCKSLTSIEIPDSITSIGQDAFIGTPLYHDKANWDNDVIYIDKCLIKVHSPIGAYYAIKNGTICIADCAFSQSTGLTSITIPDSVTSIGGAAFYGCTGLTSIEIPNSVTSIGDSAFEYCTSLTSIEIPDSVTSIGYRAFFGCTSLTSVTIPDSVTSIGKVAFCDCTSLTSIEIPDSVTSIGGHAFLCCSSLTSIVISESVTIIEYGAFSGCNNLETVYFNAKNCTEMGSSGSSSVFYNCTKLSKVVIGKEVANIPNCAFYGCTGLTSIEIPDSVTSIGSNAFSGCNSLATVYFNAKNCTKMGLSGSYSVFYNCTKLSTVVIGKDVAIIPNYAFYGCTGLTSITISDSVTSIGEKAFYDCKSLISIEIPDSVKSIGGRAFEGCSSLASITVDENNENYCSDTFGVLYNKDKTKLIQYPIGNERASFTIPDSVTSIGYYAFEYCSSLTNVTIGNSVTRIGDSAFRDCSGLKSIKIPDSVTSIGTYAFSGCSSLTSVTIPDSVTSIGSYSFFDCIRLKDVYYSGSQKQWNKINNSYLDADAVTIHYNSTGPDDIHDDDPAPDGTTISFSENKYECYVDEEIALSGELYAPNGTSGITLEWSVSDATGVTINTPASMINTDDKHVIFSALATGNKEGTYTVTVKTSNGASSTRTVKVSSKDSGVVHPKPFDPNSSSNIYQVNGKIENYTTHISLNSSDPAYVESVVINGKTYSIKKDVLSPDRAEELKGKNIVFEYDKDKNVITAIDRCREFNELNQDDINAINNERRINVKIDNEYKWSHGKVYVAGGTREVTSIPFKIVIGNTVPLNYSDLSDNCKNNNAFDYEVSSVKLKGIENCGNVSFSNNSFPKTVKLGKELVLDGTIVLPSDFWLGYEDSQKTISAEYEIKMKSGEIIKHEFSTVVINRDPKTKTNDENKMLADAATKLKNVPNYAISLGKLEEDLGFTQNQVKYLEKVVMTEIALYTMPAKSLEQYVSDKIIKDIFKVNNPLTIQNGTMTIVLPKVKYEGRTIQVDIVCDIQGYSLLDRTFGNFSRITYHAYNLTKNGKREKYDFKNGEAGLNVYADVDAFTKAATDLALGEIKSASKKALDGYETVEQIIFGDTALKILNAAGYNSFFDFGWDLYVNECKKITLSCPVDVYVYDKDDNLCGSIVNGEVTLDTSDDIDLEVINDDKIVTLWEDGYYIKTVSNCNGTLNVTVSEKGYVNGDIRMLTFEDLPLEIGTIYKQGYGEGYYDDTEAYEIESFNDEMIQATSDTLNIQSLEQVTISYDANGGEVAESSKTVLEGEYVILPSATKEGYNLLGWTSPYDSTYVFDVGSSFKAISNTTLTAVWEKDQTINSSVKSVSINDVSIDYKSSATLTPKITADEGASYTVTYNSSNPSAVSVDNSGRVTSNKTFGFTPGSATITCTVTDTNGNTVTDTCTVTVQFSAIQWIIKIVLFGWLWY